MYRWILFLSEALDTCMGKVKVPTQVTQPRYNLALTLANNHSDTIVRP